jgi:tetratricopeptide (TPR) repeat protein
MLRRMDLSPESRLSGAQAVLRRNLEKSGRDSPRTANAMIALADELQQQNRISEELLLREQIVEAVQRNLGPDNEDTLKAAMDLANCLLALDRPDDAGRLLATAIAEAGSTSAKKAEAVYSLAVIHAGARRFEEAEGLLKEILPLYAQNGADEDLAALEVSTTLGAVLVNLEKMDEAVPLLRHVLDVRIRRLGPDDPETMSTLHLLASVLARAKQFHEARLLARSLVEQRTNMFGEEHPDTAEAREFLATIESLGDSSSD